MSLQQCCQCHSFIIRLIAYASLNCSANHRLLVSFWIGKSVLLIIRTSVQMQPDSWEYSKANPSFFALLNRGGFWIIYCSLIGKPFNIFMHLKIFRFHPFLFHIPRETFFFLQHKSFYPFCQIWHINVNNTIVFDLCLRKHCTSLNQVELQLYDLLWALTPGINYLYILEKHNIYRLFKQDLMANWRKTQMFQSDAGTRKRSMKHEEGDY